MKSGVQKNIDYVLNNCNEDIIILGSSRAMHHYNPEIIGNYCNMSCYNGGMGGQSLLFFRAQEICFLKRYKPKVLVIDLIPYSIKNTKGENNPYDKLNCLYPYYDKVPQINFLIDFKGKSERYKLKFETYRYNSFFYDIIKNNILKPKDNKGFYKISKIMPENLKNEIKNNSIKYNKEKSKEYFYKYLDTNMTKALADIIEDCNKNNILLIISYSPICSYSDSPDFDFEHLIDYINDLKKKYNNINVFNYINDERFLSHYELFWDNVHLNARGSTIFSEIFAKDLKNLLDGRKN